MENKKDNISAIITVYNKKDTIQQTIKSLLRQEVHLKEIFIIDDGSNDGSTEVIKKIASNHYQITPIFLKKNQGYAYALNSGMEKINGELVIVLDGDAILEDRWISKLIPYLGDKKVAAISGITKLANSKNIWASLGGYSVEYRQSKIKGIFVDHLSTCNTIYRKSVLDEVGLFDTKFYYGSDNELSYRLINAGYKLILSKDAFCLHFWPESFIGFLKQRFHGAMGRAKLIRKYPKRWKGDMVTRLQYIIELPIIILLVFFLIGAFVYKPFLIPVAFTILFIYALQLGEIKFFLSKRKVIIGLLLPFFSLPRTLAWITGIIYFCFCRCFKKDEN